MTFLDLFFPKTCVICHRFGGYLCTDCFAKVSFDVKMICTICNQPSIDGLTHPSCKGKNIIDGVFCGVSYKHVVNQLIYAFKYEPYVRDLAKTLAELMYESLVQKEVIGSLLTEKNGILVPIPLHRRKLNRRGYNQSELLAKKFALLSGMPVLRVLDRVQSTKPQFGLSKEERKKNMRDVFALKKKLDGRKTVFLIDDVMTTGATLLEAARALKRNGVREVYGLCLAREQNE